MTSNEDRLKVYRKYGKERLAIAAECKSPEDWQKLWTKPKCEYPFKWGECWKQCIEYVVDDYAAEIGFLIEILGLHTNAFANDFAMFTSPDGAFYFAVVPKPSNGISTPPDAIRLQFMIENIIKTSKELEKRGIEFVKKPEPFNEGSALYHGFFRTPHGIPVDLWGLIGP